MVIFTLIKRVLVGFLSIFFSDLWNETIRRNFQEIITALPNDLPQVSTSEGEVLIKEVSKKEV